MEKVKEKLGLGHKHHDETETYAAAGPKQYETHTQVIEKTPHMRTEHQTEYVPRVHEHREEIEVPKHKIVMEKEHINVREVRNEPVKRDVAVPTGQYSERVVDEHHQPGLHTGTGHHTGTGVGHTGVGHTGVGTEYGHTGTATGVHTGTTTGVGSTATGTHPHENRSMMEKIKDVVTPGKHH